MKHFFFIEAQVFTGHNGGIKRALFCRGDSCIVSCADDKTMRLWDRTLCKASFST